MKHSYYNQSTNNFIARQQTSSYLHEIDLMRLSSRKKKKVRPTSGLCGDGEKWKIMFFDYLSNAPMWLLFTYAITLIMCSPVLLMVVVYLPYILVFLIRRICYIPFESI